MIQRSLGQILKALEPVGKADNVYGVASSERINAIQDALRLLARGDNIVSGGGVKRTAGDGYVVLRAGRSSRPIVPGSDFPWKITLNSDENGPFVTVNPGTITNLLAINALDKIYINDDPGAIWFIKVDCLTNGHVPTSVQLYTNNIAENNAGAVAENTPPSEFIVTIGFVQALTVYQIVFDNLNAYPDIAFIESITPPELGLEPFKRWWTWKVE